MRDRCTVANDKAEKTGVKAQASPKCVEKEVQRRMSEVGLLLLLCLLSKSDCQSDSGRVQQQKSYAIAPFTVIASFCETFLIVAAKPLEEI